MVEMDEAQQLNLDHLMGERNSLEETHPLACALLSNEIERIKSGGKFEFIELHHPKTKVEFRVKIPIKEYPQINFVGKILGQGGENVKRLQEATGVRIAVLGRGSMKDKAKAEELRQQGGKYAHLNHDLHVWFEVNGHPVECYQRIAHAFQIVHPFLVPDPNDLEQMQQQNGGMGRGRGGRRGRGPARGGMLMGRGGRGGAMMGSGMAAPQMRGGRGQMLGRGAARGAMPMRGRGRGAAGPSMAAAPPPYTDEQYEYEAASGGYGMAYGDTLASYETPVAAEIADPYQYESYAEVDLAYGQYGDAGWGAEAMPTAPSAFGKTTPPSRGGLSQFRNRPY